jgi:hypothetical protein
MLLAINYHQRFRVPFSRVDFASNSFTGGAAIVRPCEAEDGPRTRDLRLGKPTLYQLSYFRVRAKVYRAS